MRTLVLLAMLFYSVVVARANDSVVIGVGGTFRPLKGEHKSIRMVRERVRMTVFPNYTYRVTVDFVFHNDGPATRVLMGFPESGGGVDVEPDDYQNKSGFNSFATWVDGRRVRVRRVATPEGSGDYEAHWIKRVRFRRGQMRHIRVRYTSEVGGDSSGYSFANYNFSGGNWHGEVEESTLTATFRVPGKSEVQRRFNYRNPTGRGSASEHRRGNRFFYRLRHWQAEGDFSLYFRPVLPNALGVNFDKAGREVYESTVDVPGLVSFPIYRAIRPAAVALHGGMTVMDLCELGEWFNTLKPDQKDWLMPSLKWRPRYDDNSVYPPALPFSYVHWRERDRTAWLRVGVHVFGFRAGKARMTINGKVHRLPAAPLHVLDRGWYHIYVPLAPIMKTLHGKVRVLPGQRRVWFHL